MSEEEEGWKDDDFLSFGEGDHHQEKSGRLDHTTSKNPVKVTGDSAGRLNKNSTSRNNNTEVELLSVANSDLPPWMDDYTNFRRVSPLVALHNEIVGFCNLMSPMPEEMEQRNDLVDRFKILAHKAFGAEKCEFNVFGSQATGLCLPSSDIDIVLLLKGDDKNVGGANMAKSSGDATSSSSSNPKKSDGDTKKGAEKGTGKDKGGGDDDDDEWQQMREKSPLEELADILREEWRDQLSYLEVIEKTKVPLVKFTHAPSGISVDVSFLKETGPQAATLMKTFMEAMPPLRPLIFVLKYFLAARVLNEPYSGGVGSYMLQLMIVSFLQQRERDSANFGCLGSLLFEFMELYGTRFNYCTTGISVRHDGAYFRKGERKEHFVMPSRPFSLAMENPLDITSDVGKASFRISTVQRAFAAAYKVLLAHVAAPVEPAVSILATIIPPTNEMLHRKIAKGSSMMTSSISARVDSPLKEGRSPQRKKRRFR